MYFLRLENENIVEYLFSDVTVEGCVEISEEEYYIALNHRKFNPEIREFSDKIQQPLEPINEHEEITKEVYQTTSLSADDNLINMDLLISIDDKLNLIMDHLGLNG